MEKYDVNQGFIVSMMDQYEKNINDKKITYSHPFNLNSMLNQ